MAVCTSISTSSARTHETISYSTNAAEIDIIHVHVNACVRPGDLLRVEDAASDTASSSTTISGNEMLFIDRSESTAS